MRRSRKSCDYATYASGQKARAKARGNGSMRKSRNSWNYATYASRQKARSKSQGEWVNAEDQKIVRLRDLRLGTKAKGKSRVPGAMWRS